MADILQFLKACNNRDISLLGLKIFFPWKTVPIINTRKKNLLKSFILLVALPLTYSLTVYVVHIP